LYSTIDKSPQAFNQVFADSLQVRYKSSLINQLLNPVNDGIKADNILTKAMRSANNSRIEGLISSEYQEILSKIKQ